jgi:hypothetical protein
VAATTHLKGDLVLHRTTVSLPAIIGITLFSAAGVQARHLDTPTDVTVCLRNTIIATPGVVERAKQVAKQMFASIGINLAWRGDVPDHQSGVSIKVVLTSGWPGDEEPGALGEAYPFALDRGITVRYDRVHNSAGVSKDLEPLILAHVLVHEITHILQCIDRHSDAGVMKARWTSDDYYDMRWKPLEFTPEDVELIRLGMQVLRSRIENQAEAVRLEHSR